MKLSDVFLEAAETIARSKEECMCNRIHDVLQKHLYKQDINKKTHDRLTEEAFRILDAFSPNVPNGHVWFVSSLKNMTHEKQEKIWKVTVIQKTRIDILLWCASVAESEGL